MHLGNLPLGHMEFGHGTRFGGGNLHQRLVGHDFDNGLVFFNLIAFRDAPLDHFALDDAFANIRQ